MVNLLSLRNDRTVSPLTHHKWLKTPYCGVNTVVDLINISEFLDDILVFSINILGVQVYSKILKSVAYSQRIMYIYIYGKRGFQFKGKVGDMGWDAECTGGMGLPTMKISKYTLSAC